MSYATFTTRFFGFAFDLTRIRLGLAHLRYTVAGAVNDNTTGDDL